MTLRITIFAALTLLAGNASANFFDGFDMGNFFGTTGQTHSNGASNANGHSRGRGAADITMDFDLNFRAKADSMFKADGRGQNTTPYSYAYPYQYSYYYTPYTQGYYYPQYYPQAYYLPPAQ